MESNAPRAPGQRGVGGGVGAVRTRGRSAGVCQSPKAPGSCACASIATTSPHTRRNWASTPIREVRAHKPCWLQRRRLCSPPTPRNPRTGNTCTLQLDNRIEHHVAVAKELIGQQKRDRALLALKKKKLAEQQQQQVHAFLLNLEDMVGAGGQQGIGALCAASSGA